MLTTALGQVAVVLARLLDRAGPAQVSSVAAWARELRAVMAAALAAAPVVEDDPITRIRRSMREKRGGTVGRLVPAPG